MFKYDKNTKQIEITRGDTASFQISAKDEEGKPYTFEQGSIVRLKITEKNNENVVVFDKDIDIEEDMLKVDVTLTSEETKIGCVINQPTTYWYEISVIYGNIVQTIVGYDKNGAKELILYPEALEVVNNG